MGVCLHPIEVNVCDRSFFTLYVVKKGDTKKNLLINGLP